MSLHNKRYYFAACAYGVRDGDYSCILMPKAKKDISLSRQMLDELLVVRLKQLISYAEKHSLYYKEVFKLSCVSANMVNSVSDLSSFPILTKNLLNKNLEEIITGPIKTSWKKNSTGGTTSSPVVFYSNKKATCLKNAYSKVMDEWFGRHIGVQSAVLWGASQDLPHSQSLSAKLRYFLYKRQMLLPSAPLDDEIMYNYYKMLILWKVEYLQAYPSALYEFCLFLDRQKLKIPYLKSVSVTAECLDNDKRLFIEAILKLRLFNWYGSREMGRVASECEFHDGMHINESAYYVEIQQDDGLPQGYGNLIITDLLNYATPFIRYKTGDIAKFKNGKCKCGRVLRRLDEISGRDTDFVVLNNGRKIRLVNCMNSDEIEKIHVIQKNYSLFTVNYVKGRNFSDSTLNKFLEYLYNALGCQVEVKFDCVLDIPLPVSGKIKFVTSEFGG